MPPKPSGRSSPATPNLASCAALSRWVSRTEAWLAASEARSLVVAAFASGLCLAAIILTSDIKSEGSALYADPGWDRHIYRLMAERGQLDVRLAPYCWRILVPALAGWSPFDLQASFFTITVAALWATGPVVFLIARLRAHRVSFALGAVLLFYSTGWGAKFIASDFWIPDGVALLLISLALWSSLGRRPLVFAIVLLVGALTKESVLLASPLYLTLNLRRGQHVRQLGATSLAALPGILLLVTLRTLLDHRNGDSEYLATLPEDIRRFPELYGHYNYRALFDEIAVEQRWKDRTWQDLVRYTLSPLGLAIPVLAVAGIGRTWALWLRLSPFIVLVYAQLLFATDTQRLIVMAAPALALLAVEGARALRLDSPVGGLLTLGLGLSSFILLLFGPSDYDPPLARQALVLACFGVLAGFVRRYCPGPAPKLQDSATAPREGPHPYDTLT